MAMSQDFMGSYLLSSVPGNRLGGECTEKSRTDSCPQAQVTLSQLELAPHSAGAW